MRSDRESLTDCHFDIGTRMTMASVERELQRRYLSDPESDREEDDRSSHWGPSRMSASKRA